MDFSKKSWLLSMRLSLVSGNCTNREFWLVVHHCKLTCTASANKHGLGFEQSYGFKHNLVFLLPDSRSLRWCGSVCQDLFIDCLSLLFQIRPQIAVHSFNFGHQSRSIRANFISFFQILSWMSFHSVKFLHPSQFILSNSFPNLSSLS